MASTPSPGTGQREIKQIFNGKVAEVFLTPLRWARTAGWPGVACVEERGEGNWSEDREGSKFQRGGASGTQGGASGPTPSPALGHFSFSLEGQFV